MSTPGERYAAARGIGNAADFKPAPSEDAVCNGKCCNRVRRGDDCIPGHYHPDCSKHVNPQPVPSTPTRETAQLSDPDLLEANEALSQIGTGDLAPASAVRAIVRYLEKRQ